MVDASKIPVGSAGKNFDALSAANDSPTADSIGAFRTICDYSHMKFDDPIVYPGQPGKSHLHTFVGNTGLNGNSTHASLLATGNSTCRGGTINKTGYWQPAMIDTRDGTPLAPNRGVIYYKTGYRGVAPGAVQPFPPGFRMIAGNAGATTEPYEFGGVIFQCSARGSDSALGEKKARIPVCAPGQDVWAMVDFPQCWDGKNIDSPDHKSHMAYAQDPKGCPATHPVPFPVVTISFVYQVPAGGDVSKWRLSSDNYSTSLPGGYSLHADWMMAWKPEFMDIWTNKCLRASVDCKAHLLGNGQAMY